MNFKTTITLLVLLLGVGAYVWFSREKPKASEKPVDHSLISVKPTDVTAVSVTGPDGKTWAAAKSVTGGPGTSVWKFTQPAPLTADTNDIEGLLTELTALKSTAESSAPAADTGLDRPQFKVTITAGGKPVAIDFGQKLIVYDGVYVKVGNAATTQVVDSSILSTLGRPANDRPRAHLSDLDPMSVGQITVACKDQPALTITKTGPAWQVTAPTTMPTDSTEADQLVSAVVNATAADFVDPSAGTDYGMDPPAATVELKPAAAGAAPVTLKVGRYFGVQKENVYVDLPGNVIVTAPAGLITALEKKPVEYHDKTVLTIDPATVRRISIATSQPATTQPAVAAVHSKIVLAVRSTAPVPLGEHRQGPPSPLTMPANVSLTPPVTMPATVPGTMPGTQPTTGPTTRPTTEPAEPPTRWALASDHDGPADDARVAALLAALQPLKAERFLPAPPETGKAGKTYEVEVSTTGKPDKFTLELFDPGDGSPLIVTTDGLTFELPSSSPLGGYLTGDYKPGSAPPPPPPPPMPAAGGLDMNSPIIRSLMRQRGGR